MTQTVDLDEIRVKLIEKLKPSGWAVKLKGFIYGSEFENILRTLYDERLAGRRFTPPLKQVFRAFELCPLDKLKVVVIGQDPYPHLGVADGIAFSCGNTMRSQPSLDHIFSALGKTVYPDMRVDHDPDLSRWAEQGVLLLNRALTCQVDKPGTHYAVWNDFVVYLMDMLSVTNSGLVFCLLGNKAQELESLVSDNHYILKASHPASAGYSKSQWDCNDLFNEANRIIEQNNGPLYKINW